MYGERGAVVGARVAERVEAKSAGLVSVGPAALAGAPAVRPYFAGSATTDSGAALAIAGTERR